MRKLARAVALSGVLAAGSLALAGPAAAVTPAAAPTTATTESTQAMAAQWPVWGVYRNLPACIAEGISLRNAGVLRAFVCVPVSTLFPRGPHFLLGLTT